MLTFLFDRTWKRLCWFALIVGLVYLPFAGRLTYYRDDWYYAYDALVGPSGVFRLLFASDRPARGPFFELYFALFRMSPLPYQLMMFFWRLAAGLGVVWLFHLLWPRQKGAGLGAGLLFALYPGFTWWVSGIEYQPMVASLALMVLSFGLTVQAMQTGKTMLKVLYILGAILTGWVYLLLVEYAAGMEVFRIALVYLAVDPAQTEPMRRRLRLTLRRWWFYLVIPAGFLAWRFLFFHSQRKATDLGAQLGGFFSDPVSTGLHWAVNFLLSLVNVTVSAWVTPLMSTFFAGTLREIFLGLLLAALAGLIAWLTLQEKAPAKSGSRKDHAAELWPLQACHVGILGLVFGILPIVVANRQIVFPNFSHYALPASLGLVFLIASILGFITNNAMRTGLMAVLVVLCGLTHQGLGTEAVREEHTIAAFWQQMAWRAPSIGRGTSLVVYYPGLSYGDDTDIVWGPADFVYYLEPQSQMPVKAPVSALTLDGPTVNDILLGREPREFLYRAHSLTYDYGNVLLISQPAADSCVHVIDARWPMVSLADDPGLRQLAPFSHVEDVETAAQPVAPPGFLFGPEPAHGWCYYFEKAELAGQQGDWKAVAALEEQAGKLGLHPNDQVEWLPFLRADAYLGNTQKVKEISTRINSEKLYKQQACRDLQAMPGVGYSLSSEMQSYIDGLFCGGG